MKTLLATSSTREQERERERHTFELSSVAGRRFTSFAAILGGPGAAGFVFDGGGENRNRGRFVRARGLRSEVLGLGVEGLGKDLIGARTDLVGSCQI